MTCEPLCVRTFAEAIQPRMNTKVDIKIPEIDTVQVKNLRKDIHFFSLLLDALAQVAPTELLTVDKSIISRLKRGEIDVPVAYLSLAQQAKSSVQVGELFAQTLTTEAYISRDSLNSAIDTIAELIRNDASLGKTTQAKFQRLRKTHTAANYLADVWVLAVKNNAKHLVKTARKRKNREEETQKETGKVLMEASEEISLNITTAPAQTAEYGVLVVTQTRPLQPSDFFRGRENKLEDVKALLTDNAKLMLLNGMGGIGKTEFCRKLYHEAITGRLPGVGSVGWLVFHENIEQTFFRQFTEVSFLTDSPSEYFTQAVRYLDNQKGNLLLFIDNANELSDKDAASLLQLHCKIVLTSRRRSLERLKAIEIGKLTLEDCRILYRQHSEVYPFSADYNYGVTYAEDASPNEDLDAIIEMADRHTLAVELLAKTQKSAAYTVSEMRETLTRTGFSLSGITESITYVHTPEMGEWDEAERVFIEQFAKVLDITNIKNEKLRVLQLFSLLSADVVSAENTKRWFEVDDLETVNNLVSQGWIFRGLSSGQEGIAFSMHPLISSVVRYKALPSFETAAPLAIGLSEALSYDDTDLYTTRLPHINHAVSLVEAITGNYDEYPDLINSIAVILIQMNELDKALNLLEKARGICESDKDIDPIVISSVYHNMAGCYIRKGEIEIAKEYYQKSIDLRENSSDESDSRLATSYDCLGNAYEILGNYKKSLELTLKGLDLRRKELGDRHPQTAISMNNVGCVYESLGDYQQSLRYHREAMAIQIETLDKYHPDLSATYNNIGHDYERLGQPNRALEYFNKALDASEVFGDEHPDNLATLDNIAGLYMDMGEYDRAEEMLKKILKTRIRVLGETHREASISHHNLGIVYFYKGQFDDALEQFNIALKIEIDALGEHHSNVGTMYKSIADVYSDIDGMESEALELYKKVLDIEVEALGDNHPQVAISYNNLGCCYAENDEYASAMDCYQKALAIQERTVGRDNINTSGTLYNMGRAYDERGEYQKSLDYFMEALDLVKKAYGTDHPEIGVMSGAIADVYDHIGNYKDADKWFKNAIRLYDKYNGDVDLQTSVVYCNYAEFLSRRSRTEDALNAYKRAYDIQLALLESDHEVVTFTRGRIDELENKLIFGEPSENSVTSIVLRNVGGWLADYKRKKGIQVDADILPSIKSDANRGVEVSLYELLADRNQNDNVVLLYGEGGIGKSYILLDYCEKMLMAGKCLPLYIPMRDVARTDESPILQYVFDKYLVGLDWERDPNPLKRAIRDMLNSDEIRLVFVLDGMNEYAINANERENAVISEEIRWIRGSKNTKVIVSSRSRKGFEDAYPVRVQTLDSERVRNFLKAHENTSSIDLSKASEDFIRLLQLPLLLSLFTKTYSPQYTELGEADMHSATKHSDILQLCVEYHKKRLRKTSSVNYALDILLPLVSLVTDMEMSIEEIELAKKAYQELQLTMSSMYEGLWYNNRGIYDKNKIYDLGKDEYTFFISLIGETILDNAIFLTENDKTVSWQHELLLDWFVANGIILNLTYRRDYAEKKIEELSDEISITGTKADGLLPIALFLYEMLETTGESESYLFVSLLTAIARSYHNSKDNANIYKFTTLALKKIEKLTINDCSNWMKADLINHNAYMLLSVPEYEMTDNFNYDKCESYLHQALTLLGSTQKDAEIKRKVRLIAAQIYGNLGAYCLAKNKTTGDMSFVRQAVEYHEKGFELRKELFEDCPDTTDADRDIGTSYHCLATDYFYLGELELSLDYHRKAIMHREKPGSQDIRKVESYTRCIGTLNKLIANRVENWREYFEESVDFYGRALEYTTCFLKNHSELKKLQSDCTATICFINERGDIATDEIVKTVRDIARRVDALCAESSITSELVTQIRIIDHKRSKGDTYV